MAALELPNMTGLIMTLFSFVLIGWFVFCWLPLSLLLNTYLFWPLGWNTDSYFGLVNIWLSDQKTFNRSQYLCFLIWQQAKETARLQFTILPVRVHIFLVFNCIFYGMLKLYLITCCRSLYKGIPYHIFQPDFI